MPALDDQTGPAAFSARWAAAAGTTVIPMSSAEMDYQTDPLIVCAIQERLAHPLTYPPPYTESGVAQVIVDYYCRQHDLVVPPAAVWLTSGTVPQSYLLMRELVRPGDEVIFFTPSYHSVPDAVLSAGGTPVGIELQPLRQPAWDHSALLRRIGKRTKAIYLCHPHNPTGYSFPVDELRLIADTADKHGLLILSNEIHSRLTLDAVHVPMAKYAPGRTITLTGATKSHNLAGLGGGCSFSCAELLIARFRSAVGHALAPARAVQQAALVAAYGEDSPWLIETRTRLRRNRDRLCTALRQRCRKIAFFAPSATYFLWLDFSQYGLDVDAAALLLEKCGIRGLPGAGFGAGRHMVRLVLALREPVMEVAIERLIGGLG